MAVRALGHVLKQEKEGALPLVQSTVVTRSRCDKNGQWVLLGWLFWNQSASLLACSKELKLEVADQIAWPKLIQNFRPY
jgi:hypothetical protein